LYEPCLKLFTRIVIDLFEIFSNVASRTGNLSE
jgi:hypothetical protein